MNPLPNRRQIARALRQCGAAYRPERKHKRLSREANPFFRQIYRQVARAIDLQRRVADHEASIVFEQHRIQIRSHRRKGAARPKPAFEQNLGQRNRSHRRSIECDAADLLNRHLADQKNRTYGAACRDGNAGKNRQIRNLCIRRSGNDANVRPSGLQLRRACGRQSIGNIEVDRGGAVFEIYPD